MKCAIFVAAFAALLPVWPVPGRAEDAQALRGAVVSVEAPAAIPLNEPLRHRFGVGTMPAISASLPVGRWTLLGLRLRGGLLQWPSSFRQGDSGSRNGRSAGAVCYR
jgi:hypothetical protein